MLIDTHAHLWWSIFEGEVDKVIKRASEAGVKKIIVPGTDLETSKLAVELAKQYPGVIFAAVGIHPEEISTNNLQDTIYNLQKMIIEDREYIVAIGEVGTDKHGEQESEIEQQKLIFAQQLRLAEEMSLPVIIHTRESWAETWEELEKFKQLKAVFHCFSYGETELEQALSRGAWVGIGGNITWSKRIQKVVKIIPSERLLVETDSPLMTPLELKPETNEPANVKIIAQMVADLKGYTLKEVEEQTTENAERLFNI